MKSLACVVGICIALLLFGGCSPKNTTGVADQGKVSMGESQAPPTIPPHGGGGTDTGGETIIETDTRGADHTPDENGEVLIPLPVNLQDVFFTYDSSDINDEGKSKLKQLASLLTRSKGTTMIIEGHCDERGTTEYNLALGDKRARSVANYLLAKGIGSARMDVISYGKEKPICHEQIEACWARNRRAHFVLTDEGK